MVKKYGFGLNIECKIIHNKIYLTRQQEIFQAPPELLQATVKLWIIKVPFTGQHCLDVVLLRTHLQHPLNTHLQHCHISHYNQGNVFKYSYSNPRKENQGKLNHKKQLKVCRIAKCALDCPFDFTLEELKK